MNKSQVRINAERDPNYCPYCMRCSGLHRMRKVEPFLWAHSCGAVHDEREGDEPPIVVIDTAPFIQEKP